MTPASSIYAVPVDFDLNSLIDKLGGAFSASIGPWIPTARAYFDSFDWRLYDQGSVLLEERLGQQIGITWGSLASGTPLASLSGFSLPAFVAELPMSPMRQRLAACLEMRALLPLVRIEGRQRTCEIRDQREKVIARLVQESWHLASDQETRNGVPPSDESRTQLRLVPIRGFETACRQLKKAIQRAPGVSAQESDTFELALAAIGRRPGDYTSKLRLAFAADLRSDSALRRVLQQLLETLMANLPGTRGDLDSEFLHDFRVSVRRARSALGQIKGVLPRGRIARFRDELAWLGQVTGPMRDLDVALLKFDDYRASLSEVHRPAIEPLRDFLQRQKSEVHRDLYLVLASRRFDRILKDWRRLAAEPGETGPAGGAEAPKAAIPIGQLSAERITRSYRRVLEDGSRIGPKTPAEALHELRKDCKKMRYLMEFFRSLYPERDIKGAINVFKNLQENLGDFQDLEVQQDQLRGYGRDMSEAGLMSPATEDAIAALVRQLEQGQSAARQEFAARFKAFSAKANRRAFEQLFVDPSARRRKRGGKAKSAKT